MLTYSALREMQKKETESAALVGVEPDFYEKVARLLERKKQEAQESNSLLTIREYENIKKVIQGIQGKREEKIALLALRGEHEGRGLSHEETQLLQNLVEAISQARTTVKNVWESEPRRLPRQIRILREVEQYTGLDNHLYGPFKTGEQPLLPKEEIDWLLKAKMAELL